MKKKLLLNLFFTFLISVVMTGLLFIIWYSIQTMGFEEKQGVGILFLLLTIGQNLAIAIFTLPILLQIDNTNYLKSRTKYLYLTASPIMTSTIFYFFCLNGVGEKTTIAFLIPTLTFVLINSLFYNRLKLTIDKSIQEK